MTDFREIPLSRGLVTMVDAADYDWLNQWKWYAKMDGSMRTKFYAARSYTAKEMEKPKAAVQMHRLILGVHKDRDKRVVDHINGNPLDNRRCNLRLVSERVNQLNSKPNRNNTSGFKGVVRQKATGKYAAQIKIHRKPHILGYFNDPAEASRVYEAKRQELIASALEGGE